MRTDKKHFEIFKKECQKWIDFFGLKEFDVHITHEALDDNAWATCTAGYKNKFAQIKFCKEWCNQKPLNEYNIKKIAFHEVCHLLLWDIVELGMSRYLEENEFTNKEHEIIQKLSNSIFNSIK